MRVTEFGAALLLTTCLAGWSAIPSAFAQTAGQSAENSALRRVRITVNARPLDAHTLDALLFEWFGSVAPHLQLAHVEISTQLDVMTASRESDLLRIWIALQGGTLARVYFADPAGERFFLRDVPLRNGLDELGREQLAQVVVTSSLAFIEGRVSTRIELVQRSLRSAQPQLQSAPYPRPSLEPHPVSTAGRALPAQQTQWYPRFGAYYMLALEQVGVWRNGPGLTIGLARQHGQRRFIADFKVHYLWQVTLTAPDVLLSLRTLGTRLTVGYESLFAGNAAGCEAGVILDSVDYEPHARAPNGVLLRGSAHQWRPGGYLGARLAHELGAVRATLLAGVAIYEPPTQYAILRDGQQQTEYSPFTAQPRAALELSWR